MTRLLIGIDPGTKTGLAIAIDGKLDTLQTIKIHHAMEIIEHELVKEYDDIMIVIEDARLINYANKNQARAQGAGSVKRDCRIWQDFFGDYSEMKNLCICFVKPQNTKISAKQFENITGWQKRTSNHARDAAMLIYGL